MRTCFRTDVSEAVAYFRQMRQEKAALPVPIATTGGGGGGGGAPGSGGAGGGGGGVGGGQAAVAMAAASAGTLSLHALLVARLALFWGRVQANMTCSPPDTGAKNSGGSPQGKSAASVLTEEERELQQLQDFKKWLRRMSANQKSKVDALQSAFASMAANPAATEEQIKVYR